MVAQVTRIVENIFGTGFFKLFTRYSTAEEPDRLHSAFIHGIKRLPVAWTPREPVGYRRSAPIGVSSR